MSTHDPLLIYGATGFTGKAIVREAVNRGLAPIVAGRNRETVAALAAELGLPHRIAAVDDPAALVRALDGIAVVLNVAGPFSATALPMAVACLETGAHYLDVAGELDVFERLQGLHATAAKREVMVLPGVGFVNVPSDCLAAHIAQRVPNAQYLRIGISRTSFIASGSVRTMIELIDSHVRIRRAGRLTRVPVGRVERRFDYGSGPSTSTALSWPDVLTAHLTTGIPNIEVYAEASPIERGVYQTGSYFARTLRSTTWQNLLKSQASSWRSVRAGADRRRRTFVAEAEDPYRRITMTRLDTPDGYRFTTDSALVIASHVLAGNLIPGFQTPARVYGTGLLSQCANVDLEDLRQ